MAGQPDGTSAVSRIRPRAKTRPRRARKRDRILIVACSLVAAGLTTAMLYDFRTNGVAAVDYVQHSVAASSGEQWTLQFLGDTMLGDGAQPLLDTAGYDLPFGTVLPLLDGDVIVANAEGPISTQTIPANPGKTYSYNSDPQAAGAMKRAGIDVLGLGNNHSTDMGLEGLQDTMRLAAEAGMATFGAGHNIGIAERPLVVRSELGNVGIVSLGEHFGKSTKATADNPGTVVLSPGTIQRGYDLARAAGAEWVVAYVHWGDNYEDTTIQQRYWAQLLVDAGYDLVVGTGPHVAAPIEFIGTVPVAYSIGNFVFGTPGRFKSFGQDGIGLLLSVELKRDSAATLAVKCIVTDNLVTGFLAHPCSEAQLKDIIPRTNPQLELQGNVARMPCECFGKRG